MCASLGALSAGGLDVVKEGLGLYINFMNPGDSAATFRSGGYMAGLTVNATAGTLDANIWRVQGLNGASMANPCYTASPPTSNNFYVGQYVGGCGALFFFPVLQSALWTLVSHPQNFLYCLPCIGREDGVHSPR